MEEGKFVEEFNHFKKSFLEEVFTKLKKFRNKDELEYYFFGCGGLETSPLIEEIFNMCLKDGFAINSFYLIKTIPLDTQLRKYPEFFDVTFSGKLNENEQEKVFPNLILEKGVLYKILEHLRLEKSKKWLIMYKIVKDNEINQEAYYSSKELKSFDEGDFQKILVEELEEKHKDKGIFIEK